jgi:uncharacterized protein YndB with AHSA1/START domain
MSPKARGFVHRVDIRAEQADVWQALIDPKIMARWHVPNARVDAREGGVYWTPLTATLTREAHIDIFQPPRRLRLIFMPQQGLPDDGSVVVEDFLIDRDEAGTRAAGATVTILRLMGSGISDQREWDATYVRLRTGWERALLRLKASFEKSDKKDKSEDSALRRGRTGKAKRAAVDKPADKILDWPQATKQQKPQPDDFIPWPEPTEPKRR